MKSQEIQNSCNVFCIKWSLVGQKGHVQATRVHVGEGGGVGHHFWVNAQISH
jgi:hypothetical protein